MDRILGSFARRWVECNPTNIFGTSGTPQFSWTSLTNHPKSDRSLSPLFLLLLDTCSDVVHVCIYAILMLNTDLHISTDPAKMSRNAFIKNITGCIQENSSNTDPRQSTSNDHATSVDDLSTTPRESTDVFSARKRSGSLVGSIKDKGNGSMSSLMASHRSLGSSTSSSVTAQPSEGDGSEGGGGTMGRPRATRFGSSATSLPPGMFSKAWEAELDSILKVT
jgi:hypothetical protein